MSALADNATPILSAERQQALQAACARIAPAWPLDQLIAVNPLWQWREQPFHQVAAQLATLGHMHCLMSLADYRRYWQQPVSEAHLVTACQMLALPFDREALLDQPPPAPVPHWYNISDLIDKQWLGDGSSRQRISWHEEIIHQLSQFSGDLLLRSERATLTGEQFYQQWRAVVQADRGLAVLMSSQRLTGLFAALPDTIDALFSQALDALCQNEQQLAQYATALLLDIHGWASSLAWLGWQARLRGGEHSALLGLLAARLAWDYVLWQLHAEHNDTAWQQHWQQQWQQLPTLTRQHAEVQHSALIWQRAIELAYQQQLIAELQAPAVPADNDRPVLQAAFCIDVRSEVIRRALEAQHPGIRTIGFAGFFGLPIEHQHGNHVRPQLPGLLAPALRVTDDQPAPSAAGMSWARFISTAPSTFTAIEAGGLLYLFKLLRQSLFPGASEHPLRPSAQSRLTLRRGATPLSNDDKAELADGILNAMGFATQFAPRVLLVGHGSSTRNNPQAAALDCGACCGQSGEVNVRVLAQLLNDSEVRQALQQRGRCIPEDTRFIAALHDTTCDHIHCFGNHPISKNDPLHGWLDGAGAQAGRERAAALGIDADVDIQRALKQRSRDWSEVRPEWGLANNASFIVAPRQRSRHLNLQGRTFLHDYQWQQDKDFSLLELIMTAPMIVAHWINMQYNLSVTDNDRFGSGNKVLHNVVGGNLGVFEGNGGDLRIGLAMQSLHDGQRWMHQPLRLSVFIAAPHSALDTVIDKHDSVRQLLENDWLFLFRLGDEHADITRWSSEGWCKGAGH